MSKMAQAWNHYQDAAMVEMVLDKLPSVAAEIAAPLARVNKVTMVSSGGGDIGAAKLTAEVMNAVSQVPMVIVSYFHEQNLKSIVACRKYDWCSSWCFVVEEEIQRINFHCLRISFKNYNKLSVQ